jgi:hypothetical protein
MALDTLNGDPAVTPGTENEEAVYDPGALGVIQRQLAVTRASQLAERKKSWDNVAQALEKSRPSKSEMWFSLASALAQPTKTGSFGETLGNVSQTLGETRKAQREFDTSVAKNQFERDQDLAELGSKYDLKGYDLQAKALAATGKPLGNVGFHPDTHEPTYISGRYAGSSVKDVAAMLGGNGSPPSSGNITQKYPIGTRVSGLEIGAGTNKQYVAVAGGKFDLIPGQESADTNAEATNLAKIDLKSIDVADEQLRRALELNDKAFSGPLSSLQKTISRYTAPDDPKLVASAELNTIIGNNIVSALKAALGTQPTDKDLAFFKELNGLDANSTAAERAAVFKHGQERLADRRRMAQESIAIRAPQSGRQSAPTAPPSKNLPPLDSFYKTDK